jgi:hypothetical protein
MWNVKIKVIPALTVATGTFSKSLKKYLSNIPGKHEIKGLQTSAIFGTAHTHTHTAENANVKAQNIQHGK